jgi:UTP--glucose-1-phosphate uridylyltransferase
MKLTQAILPVAGLGTRFLPWTKVVPKELLPIGNQPIIALLVDECLSIGITDICFVINRGKEAIPQYFYSHPSLEHELKQRGKLHMLEELSRYHTVNFHVVYQDQMLGDGHAIAQASDWVRSDTVAILFGDDLIVGEKNGLEQLYAAWSHLHHPADTTMLCLQNVPRPNVSKYGIADVDQAWKAPAGDHRLHKISGLVEKPSPEDAPSTLGIVGKYLVPKSIIRRLHQLEEGSHGGEIRLIDALMQELGTMHVYGCEFYGQRLDTGTPEGYREAVAILG